MSIKGLGDEPGEGTKQNHGRWRNSHSKICITAKIPETIGPAKQTFCAIKETCVSNMAIQTNHSPEEKA
ncbi:hypothetical protein D3Z58_18645 [Clostridiaceae bacterium]|nr:hypothetical protein [Clostridiaceae bacterium]